MWKTFGEGPLAEAANPMNAQGFNAGQKYSAQDVRYVQAPHAQKGATTVYATIMAWPAAGSFTFKALAKSPDCGKVKAVTLLGGGKVKFKQHEGGLTVQIPAAHPNDIAPVFRITVK